MAVDGFPVLTMDDCILIVGASARAAAESVVSAGFAAITFDLFADQDLQAIATTTRLTAAEYPVALPNLLKRLAEPTPCLFTGGIENHPEVARAIGQRHQLLGSSPDVLGQTRDVTRLAAVARRAGWQYPECLPGLTAKAICKPRKHVGGHGVRLVRPGDTVDVERCLIQPFVPGTVYGAVLLAVPERRRAHLLGVTKQRTVIDDGKHPLAEQHPFTYSGSLGPVLMKNADQRAWRSLGIQLMEEFSLCGIFGIDAIHNPGSGWTLLELNPRWTASVEVIERAYGFNAFRAHYSACRGHAIAARLPGGVPRLNCGKRIVYASQRLPIDPAWHNRIEQLIAANSHLSVHDVPCAGTTVERMHPVLTLMATGVDLIAIELALDDAAKELCQINSRQAEPHRRPPKGIP